jgi:YD repeat-containing protein
MERPALMPNPTAAPRGRTRAGISLRLAALAMALVPGVATAAESVTYSYDALGRLIRTQRSGGPASGVDAQIQYDSAGNRTNVTVNGASSSSPPVRVIVVPLNGYTIIPLPS